MKSQANALTAVLKNWQDVENAIDIYANSAGSALRENEIYLDSWEAKSNAVSVTWNEFVNTFLSTDMFKGFLDGAQDILSWLTETNAIIPVLAGSIIGTLTFAIQSLIKWIQSLEIALAKANLLSGGLPLLIGLATTVIAGLISWGISSSDTAKQIENLTDKINEQQQAIDELNAKEQEATNMYKEYASLMSKSNAYGLTAAEKEKLLDISTQLVDKYGLEIQGIDALTGAYIIGTDAINGYVEALRAQRLEKQEEQNKTRDKRIKKNLKTAKDIQEDLNIYKTAQKNSPQFKTILERKKNFLESDQYKTLTTQEKTAQLDSYYQELLDLSHSLKLDETVLDIITQDFWGNTNIDNEIVKLESQLSNVTNSIVKDTIAQIQVDNADSINQSGENILTSMMQSILPNIDDLDEKKVKTIKKKIKKFVKDDNNGSILDILGNKNKQIQEQINSNTVGLSDYKALLENQFQQLAAIEEIFGSNSKEAKIFKNQLNESSQNNIGLTFANISQSMADLKLDTTKFDNLATSILQLDKAMSNGKITFSEYIGELNKNISNISLEDTFKKNENSAKQFFSTLTDKGQSAIQNLAAQMQNGEISQEDYLNGINNIIDYFDNLSSKSISILGDSNSEEVQKTIEEISGSIGDLKSHKTELEGLMNVIKAIPNSFEEYQNGGIIAVNSLTAALEAAGIQSLELENETITGAENIAKAMQNNSQVFAAGQTEIATRARNTLTQIGSGVGTVINGMIKLFDGVKISINPPKIGILDWIKGIVTGNKKALDYEIKVNGSVDSKSIGNLFADSFGDVDWGFNGLNSGSSVPSGGYTASQSDRSKVKSTSSPSQKETKETFNWIETALSRIQNKISNLSKKVSATWRSWGERNTALKDQIAMVTHELEMQAQARAEYAARANAVGLDDYHKRLVEEGAINIETIEDENIAKKVKEYQEWYEKMSDCDDKSEELYDTLAELAQVEFDNLAKQFEDQNTLIEHEISLLETTADLLETRGYVASKSIYQSLIQNERERKVTKQSERDALWEKLNNSGLEKGTEQWNNQYFKILDLNEDIVESENKIAGLNNKLLELDWEVFDIGQEKISNLADEADFLIELMSNEKLYNDDGSLSNQGQATLGLHAAKYNILMHQADDYAKEMQKIDAELAKDPNNQNLQNRKQEIRELIQESILGAEDIKQAIKDIVSDGYDTLLDSMNKIIDKRKEMLSQVKDLYDYEKSIAEQTAEVSKYQKIINSMQGMADTEEGQAMLQKYELSLKEAKENLEETEYDKYISDQEQLLDNLYDEAEEWLNQRLDDLDTIINQVIESTNNSASMINDTLKEEVEKVGGTLTAEMESIWNTENGSSVISKYSEQFEDKMTTVNKTLEAIKNFVEQMAKESDKAANETISTATPSTPATSPAAPASPPPAQAPAPKSITIGGQINAGGAPIYTQAGGTKGYSQYFKKDPIYTVVGEKNGYLLVRHHSLSSGYTGWFRRSDVTAYKTGGLVNETGFAWLDGTKESPEMVLNAKDTENFIALRDALSNLAQNNMFHMIHSNSKLPSFTPNAANQNVTAYNGDVHIELPNINNAQEFAEQFKEIYDKNVGKTRTMLQTDMFSKNNLEYRRYL